MCRERRHWFWDSFGTDLEDGFESDQSKEESGQWFWDSMGRVIIVRESKRRGEEKDKAAKSCRLGANTMLVESSSSS